MNNTIVADIEVCVDCLMMLANGELGQGDRAAEVAHAARMDDQWPAAEGYCLTIACAEGCEGWFGWSWCGGCGSILGGERHPVAVFQDFQS